MPIDPRSRLVLQQFRELVDAGDLKAVRARLDELGILKAKTKKELAQESLRVATERLAKAQSELEKVMAEEKA